MGQLLASPFEHTHALHLRHLGIEGSSGWFSHGVAEAAMHATAGLLAPCARLVGTKLCAGRVWSISTLHVGPDQPGRKPVPNPNHTPTLWGVRGRQGLGQSLGSAACFGDVSPKKKNGRLKGQPRPIRSASCTKFCADQSCTYST